MTYSFQTKQKKLLSKVNFGSKKPEFMLFLPKLKFITYFPSGYEKDQVLRTYNLDTGKFVMEKHYLSERMTTSIISRDGRLILTGSSLGEINVLNLDPVFEPRKQIKHTTLFDEGIIYEQQKEVFSLTASEDNEFLATIIQDYNECEIGVYKEFEQLFKVKIKEKFKDGSSVLFFTGDNKYIIFIVDQKYSKIDLEKQSIVDNFDINMLEFSRFDLDQRLLLLYSFVVSKPAIHIYSLKKPVVSEELEKLSSDLKVGQISRKGKGNPVFIKLSPDGSLLVLLTHSKEIEVYNTETRQLVNFIQKEGKSSFLDSRSRIELIISHDNKYIATLSERKVKLYHIDSQQILQQIQCDLDLFSLGFVKSDLLYFRFSPGLIFSEDGKYLVFYVDFQINVFDIEANKMILDYQPFEPRKGYDITGMDLESANCIRYVQISPDQSSLLAISDLGKIQKQSFPLMSPHTIITERVPQLPFIERKFFENMIEELKTVEDILNFVTLYKNVYLCPQRWTLLHFFAIYQPDLINQVVEIPDVKFPFLVDSFGKTPLHYMLAHKNINLVTVNAVIKYIVDYSSSIQKSNSAEFHLINNSLSGIFPMFFNQINHSVVLKFLKYNVNDVYFGSDEPIPLFGKSKDHPVVSNRLSISKENIDQMYDAKDNKMIGFKSMCLNLDYNPVSEDMMNTCIALQECDNEEFFETQAVSTLINYLWNSHFKYLLSQTLIFSLLMIITSIYIGMGDSELGLEITILTFGSLFCVMESIQMLNYGFISYYSSLWNIIDSIFCITLSGTMIARISGLEEGLARAWLYTIILISGYLKWIIHFRIFSPTRKLIRIVIEIIKDMTSFIAILIFIIFALSLILLEFDRETDFTDHLLTGYGFIYGDYETEEVSSSEIAIMVFVAFLVSVVFLNLLIAMMGDSYAKVDERSLLVDSLERIDMINEVIFMKRIFLLLEKKREKGYLMFCQNSDSHENEEENEEKTDLLQKEIKNVEAQVLGISNKLALIEEKMTDSKKSQEENLNKNNELIEKKMKYLKENNELNEKKMETFFTKNNEEMMNMANMIKELLQAKKKET